MKKTATIKAENQKEKRVSPLEEEFNLWLECNNYRSLFVREYSILKPEYLWKSKKSSWKIDFLSEPLKIAIEIQGGTYMKGLKQGAHSRGTYQHSDFDKANYLQNLGYDIYFLDTRHIKEKSYSMVEQAIKNKLSRGLIF